MASLVGGVLLGAALALVAVPAHRHLAAVAGVVIPWGLVVALVTVLLCGFAARSWGSATAGLALGWTGSLVALLPGGPGGDYVYVSDLAGWGLLAGGVACGVVLLAAGLGRRERVR